jgi:prepilin-type N-terminal cleavage/methylation domain-containing protein
MTRIIHRNGWSTGRRDAGFSLIEVMVAVVILATGLIALAALQGALSRNSADAKARGAVAAAMISRLNEFRQTPPADGSTTNTCVSGNWVCTAQIQGSIGSLTVTDTVATMIWKGGTFAVLANGDDLTAAQFKRIAMSAQWTDAAGETRTMVMRSDVSARVYGTGSGYPVNDPTGSAAKYPIVRQDNPSNTAGVIPIVTGDQATAASNPQPIIEGADSNLRVGTSFDVLNYVPEGSVAKITKRFQTQVIKCRCQYGQDGYSVAGEPQWPAVWDGATYSVYAGTGDPVGVSQAAGEDPAYDGTAKGGKKGSGREQSEQCTECCRDHHDSSATAAEARYDPEATTFGKYDESNGALTPVANTASAKYVASCRIVKVDGLWRTTADMYQRSYGLLETTSVDGVQAKSGIPSDAATSAYQSYVKDYLSTYTKTTTTAPGDPQGTFDGIAALNAPDTINIATPSTTDYRYLHGRGLYVDYLTTKAQKAIETCAGKSGTAYTECLLPVLPFTSINLTEIAKWTPSDPNILAVNTNNTLYFDVTEPSGGRTAGINGGTATSDTESLKSNSGVAVSDDIAGAVDENGDEDVSTDSQEFTVGGGSGGSGDNYFWTRLIGAGSSPGLSHTYGNCGKQGGDFQCTSSSTLPQNLTLTISKYYASGGTENTFDFSGSVACTKKNNGDADWVPGNYSVASYNTLQQMNVSSVTLWDNSTLPAGNITETGAYANEVAQFVLSNVPAMAATGYTPITVNFAKDGSPVKPTVNSCVYTYSNKSGYSIVSVVWNETWATP